MSDNIMRQLGSSTAQTVTPDGVARESTHPANHLILPNLNNPVDDQDLDSSASNPGNIVSIDEPATALLPFIGSGLMRLNEGDEAYRYAKEKFISQLRALGGQVTVVAIHQNCFSSSSAKAWAQAFEIYAQAVQQKGGGDTANIRYGWYATSKEEVPKIFTYGFGYSGKPENSGLYGCGVYFAPEHHPLESVMTAPVDEDGRQHLLLCRVILGKSELVDRGSEMSHPSSEEYDSGVDDLSSPRRLIIWRSNMNTHVLPEFVISFRTPPYLRELSRDPEMSRQPTSPWIPLSALMAELSKMFNPSELRLILDYHNDYQAERISRAMMVHRVRQIIGDNLLIKMINTLKVCGGGSLFESDIDIADVP